MKQCSRCKKSKELSEFYKNSSKKDGYGSHCKACRSTYFQTKERRKAHNYQNWQYSQTPKGKIVKARSNARFRQTEKYKTAIRKHREKYPARRKAQIILHNAVATEKISRPNFCTTCQRSCTPQGHHPDYSKPLEVIWLCHLCHMSLHWSAYSKYSE